MRAPPPGARPRHQSITDKTRDALPDLANPSHHSWPPQPFPNPPLPTHGVSPLRIGRRRRAGDGEWLPHLLRHARLLPSEYVVVVAPAPPVLFSADLGRHRLMPVVVGATGADDAPTHDTTSNNEVATVQDPLSSLLPSILAS